MEPLKTHDCLSEASFRRLGEMTANLAQANTDLIFCFVLYQEKMKAQHQYKTHKKRKILKHKYLPFPKS